MNQFPEKNSQALSDDDVTSPQAITRPVVSPIADTNTESMEFSAEQIEAKINRLIAEESVSPIAPEANPQNFDVLDYARLSSKSPTNSEPAIPEPGDFRFGHLYGEVDPYVDPAELNVNDNQNIQSDSAHQTLDQIDDFQQQLKMLETEAADRQPPLSHPTVEIIGANPKESVAVENIRQTVVSEPTGGQSDEPTPVAWFAITETSEAAKQTETLSPQTAFPIVTQEAGETIFDVRDFCDSAEGVIEPIPGSFEVEPDLFDFKTIDEIESSDDSKKENPSAQQTDANRCVQAGPLAENQIFVAGTGDVIQVNGSDGFDHINLACFDVKWATISDNVIQLDDQQGTSFAIHFQDISYALFADGVKVRLDANDPV